jgi:Helix-turn-helix domain
MNYREQNEIMNELIEKLNQALPILNKLSQDPEIIIIDDVELREMLKMSKRSTAYLREKGLITYSKIGGKIYYRHSDVLDLIERTKFPCFEC